MTHHIGFLVYPTFDLLDLSGPLEAFQWAEQFAPGSYACHVMAIGGGLVQSATGLRVETEDASSVGLDTLIVTGGGSVLAGTSPTMAEFIWNARRLRRLAGVCTGAFALADAGVLDSRAATTHWQYAARLQERHPGVCVDGDRIFIEDDGIWTSAGITAGIDMSLAMIEADIGREIAKAIARTLVVYYRRQGGQYQYSSLLEHEADNDRIQRVLTFAREHICEPLSVERLADVASLSVRQFGRAFRTATGMTPARMIDRLRVETARPRIEASRDPFDAIARDVGFADPLRMRQSFVRAFGLTPQALRRMARVRGNARAET